MAPEVKSDIKIENCLFEWNGWHRASPPTFIPPSDLKEQGFNIGNVYTIS